MQKSTIYGLLLLILCQSVGYDLLFVYFQQGHYNAVKQELKSLAPEKLHHLCLDTTTYQQLLWLKPHEFRYQNELYDLKSQYIAGNCVHLICKKDTDEQYLQTKFAEKNNIPQKNDHSSIVILKMGVLYVLPNRHIFSPIQFSSTALVAIPYSFGYCAPIGEIPSPPPKV